MSRIQISHPIHHIFQGEDGLCWASAIAMVLGRHSLEGAYDVARRAGINRENMKIQAHEIAHAFRTNSLHNVPVPSQITPDSLAAVIRSRPAVFFVSVRPGIHASNGGNGHVIVIRGMRGDGSPNTQVLVNDPWEIAGATPTFQYLTQSYWIGIDYIGRR